MTDPIAERVRKIGGSTIKSISHIARLQRVLDNDVDYIDPEDMLAELSTSFTLEPGDILSTGTPAGVGVVGLAT